uniref:Reverse transcriptase domain-containing protein n=1 Tax=Haemonchus contortus TaxID=6289 RepID=A0A7I4Z612_HAECO
MQETRCSCCKSRDIVLGFKAVLCGGPKTINGVGIIVSERFRDSKVSVERFDDRLMKIMVVIERQKYHLFSAYAPQTGCSERTKDMFWNLLDEKTAEVPLQEAIVVAGDLNGHGKEAAVVSRILLPAVTTVDETWKRATEAITRVARSKLGTTKPGRRKLDKQTWLWTDHVRDKVREKKKQYHAFLIEKTTDNWQRYQIAKNEAKKAVASEKTAHYADLNKKLESRDGERYVYRLAKTRNHQTGNIEKFYGIDDENGHLLTDRRKTLKQWREYFANISTAEFAHPAIPCAPPVHGPVQKIPVNETITASKKTKSGKATGLDDLAADLWKSKSWNPAGWLTELFNQVVAEKGWQQSMTIPIWKKKGSPANCTCHRPIRLISHSMGIFERIVDSRICDIVELTTNQRGFVAGCIDAMHATRLLLKKHCEKRRPVHFAFLDLEKAFHRVPCDVIW